MIPKRDFKLPPKRIFILETGVFPVHIENNIKVYAKEGGLDFYLETSEQSYRRHLPEGYDLYLLHPLHTEEEAIKEIRRNQPWSKIFVRPNIGEEIPSSMKSFVDGDYNLNNHDFYRVVLESIGLRVRSLDEIYGKEESKQK
jgi:hypothetical protein